MCAQGEGKDGKREVDPRIFAFLEELWRDHLPELYAFLRRFNVFDRQEADGHLAAARLRAIKGYKPKPSHTIDDFKAYFLTILRNEVIDRSRGFTAKFVRCDDETLDALSARLGISESPLDSIIEGEERAEKANLLTQLRAALLELPPNQWTILKLRFLYEGDSRPTFKEIGDALGIRENAARMRCERALHRLEKILRRQR